MKNLNLLLFSSIILLSSCSHKIFRTIATPNYYTELTPEQRQIMVDKYLRTSRYNRSLSIYDINPQNEKDSSFVRIEGFVIKKSIIVELLAIPGAEGIKFEFGVNGIERRGLRRIPIISPVISAIDLNGIRLFNTKYYDKIPPCTGSGCNFY